MQQTIKDGGKSALVGTLISGIMQAGGNVAQIIRSDPSGAARQAADAVIAEVKAGRSAVQAATPGVVTEGRKNAPAGAEAVYRAERPQNVEYPTVPIINLSLRSVAELNGGTLPQSGNYIRKTATEWAEQRLGLDKNPAAYIEASNVTRNGDAYVIKITKPALKKMLSASSYPSGIVPLESIAVLDQIERIAQNGVYFKSEGDRYNRNQVAGYDHLMTTVYIDKVPHLVDMRVRVADRKSNNGNTLYHFTPEMIEVTKKKDGAISTAGRHAPSIRSSEKTPSSNTTVPQAVPGVNGQYSHNAPSVFLPGSGLEGTWTVQDGMLPFDEKLAQTSRWLLPVDEKLAKTSRWLLPLDEKLAEQSMLPLSEAARQAGQTAVENRAIGEYTGGEKTGHGRVGEGEFTVVSEEAIQNGGKEISDPGDAESAGRVGPQARTGKESNLERCESRIRETLQKRAASDHRPGTVERESGRVETREARETFEDRVRGEGFLYVETSTQKEAIAFKGAAKQKWNANAKAAAEKLESWGYDVLVFDGKVFSNGNGVTETHEDAFTLLDSGSVTIFLSAELSANGMETAFHEGFHAARFVSMGKYHNELAETVANGVNADSEHFETFVNFIADIYSYTASNVTEDSFIKEITEEFYAWCIGKSHAETDDTMRIILGLFSDVESLGSQIDAIYAKMKTGEEVSTSENDSGENGRVSGNQQPERGVPSTGVGREPSAGREGENSETVRGKTQRDRVRNGVLSERGAGPDGGNVSVTESAARKRPTNVDLHNVIFRIMREQIV